MGLRLTSFAGLLFWGFCVVCCAQSGRGAESEATDLNRWGACEKSIECAPVLGPCGEAASTGKSHAAEYRSWANEQRPRVECAKQCFRSEADLSSYIRAGRASSNCLNRQCTILSENPCPATEERDSGLRQ